MTRPPDVLAELLTYLAGIVGVPVVARRPDNGTRPLCVRIVHTGGPGRRNRHLLTEQHTIDCYAPNMAAARDLAVLVDEAMHGLPESDVPVAAVPWSSTPANSPDPDVGSERYTATYQVVVLCS